MTCTASAKVVGLRLHTFAGVRLLPFTVASPIGSIISSTIAGKLKTPPLYLVLGASMLQLVGFILMSTLPTSSHTSKAQYGYEVIAGFGCGVNISTHMLNTPFCVEKRDQCEAYILLVRMIANRVSAVAIGTITEFRIMGAAVGLAIVTNVLNTHVRNNLLEVLSGEQVAALLEISSDIWNLPPDVRAIVQRVFAEGYNIQFKILAGFAAAQIASSLIMWQKRQITV
ncbi:MAG: hypothetical protein L6R42_000831 [Xanthoria sp. 1 TBL-2021]|nr:MAG: hypothetical protein L6R42_000831 [Xanthoria sp. 1 TBL-2021]